MRSGAVPARAGPSRIRWYQSNRCCMPGKKTKMLSRCILLRNIVVFRSNLLRIFRWEFPIKLLISLDEPHREGFAADPSTSKDGTKSVVHSNSSSSTGIMALYICLGVAAVILLAIFLWKQWKKKKREEQHARMLQLFEQDDELELELGLRD